MTKNKHRWDGIRINGLLVPLQIETSGKTNLSYDGSLAHPLELCKTLYNFENHCAVSVFNIQPLSFMNASFEPLAQVKKHQDQQRERQFVASRPSRTIVHAKLEMTKPGDQDEQEADAVADVVVSGRKIAQKISAHGSSGISVPRQMESRLMQLQGSGQPLPGGLRSMMESRFGLGFPQVRLHTDAEAAGMSSRIGAKAFTFGSDIYFNRGQFAPETPVGQRLVAHELTHVVQGAGKVGREPDLNDESKDESLDSDSSVQEGPSVFDHFWLKDDPIEAFHGTNQGILEGHSDFLKSLSGSQATRRELERMYKKYPLSPIWVINRQDENQAILVHDKKLNKGFIGTPSFIASAQRAEAAPYYREIASNVSGGLFGAYFAICSQSRGENLVQQLEASRVGAGIDEFLTSHYGVQSFTPSSSARVGRWTRFIPIERVGFEEIKPAGIASDIEGPAFPSANFTVTQNSLSNETPTIPVVPAVGNAMNASDYAPTVTKSDSATKSDAAITQFVVPSKAPATPKANIPQFVRNELHGVENSPNKQRSLNRAINNIRYYVKDSPQKDVYNMYLYNAETSLQLGKTDEAVRSLRVLEKAIESTEKK